MELLWPWSGEGKRTRLLSPNTGSAYGPDYTALGALVWSKAYKHFLGEGREGTGNIFLPHKSTSGTGPVMLSMSSHSMGTRKDKWARQFLALLTDPCLYSKFSATVKGGRRSSGSNKRCCSEI